MPKGLFPLPGEKLIIFLTFSVTSGFCNIVSVTNDRRSSTSHLASSSSSVLESVIPVASLLTDCSVF